MQHDIEAAGEYNLTPWLRREIQKIIFDHFDMLIEEWRKHFAGNEDN